VRFAAEEFHHAASAVERFPVDVSTAGADRHSIENGGELQSLIYGKDWSQTPTGPIEQWSPTLKTMVQLPSRKPLSAFCCGGAPSTA
jgi:hypothetical protein